MSMTLEEAILHAEEAASDYEGMIEDSWLDSEKLAKCANEQRQIAEWLKELAERRKQPEIIRCKDCENWDTTWQCENWDTTWQNDSAPNYHYCPMMDGLYSGDFYCGIAERRTDDKR